MEKQKKELVINVNVPTVIFVLALLIGLFSGVCRSNKHKEPIKEETFENVWMANL